MSIEKFGKIYTIIDRVRMILVIGIFAFIVSLGAVHIFMRYTPGINPMSWMDEIMRYLNIWLVLLATSIGVKHGTHLQIDYLLYKFIPVRGIKVVRFVTVLAIIAALLILIYYGTLRVLANRYTVIVSVQRPLSIAWFYAAIPVGGLIILFEYLLIFIHGKHPYVRNNAGTYFADS